MSYRMVMKSKEYWRVGTSMFLFDLDSPLDIYTLVALFTSLSALERRFFKGSPSSMISTLAFIASLLLAPGFYLRELRLKDPSFMMYIAIVTWATIRADTARFPTHSRLHFRPKPGSGKRGGGVRQCRRRFLSAEGQDGVSSKRMTLRQCFFRPAAGFRAVAGSLTPLVPIVAPHIRKGALDVALLKHQGVAIAAGLACVLLIPDAEGARVMRQQRQKAANKKAKAAAAAGGGGGAGAGKQAAPVDESSSSSEEEEEGEEEEAGSSEEEDSD
eukprot:jgi/Undpi1/2949/HiC_scaffold_14.g06326.m1